MKALFVNPYQFALVSRKGRIYNRLWPPLELAYAAAMLERDGIQPTVIDANAEQIGPAEVAERARGFDKAFVTSTSLDRWQCPQLNLDPFLRYIEALKAVVPEVYVLGSHGTVKPREMLELTGATAVVRGEPELTVAEIARNGSLAGIRGLTLPENGAIVDRPDQKPIRMDDLPLPAFHHLPMGRYRYEVLGRHFSLFEMSRGCASDCTFCLLKTYGVGVRTKSVDTLAREVEHGVKRFGVRTAYFIDLEFTILRKQVLEFCRHLIKAKYDFAWCCQTRLDLVDEEMLQLMKQAGCRLIHVGVEAGSDRMLQLVDKGITLEGIRRGMALIKTAGIETLCFFMIGFPESEARDMEDIVRLAKELNPTYASFHITAPYPGTKLYDMVRANPNVHFSDGSLFPEAIEARFTLRELKRMTRSAYLSFYTRPSYLLGRLRKGELRALANQMRLFWGYLQS
ncbi:MAG: radical SAM protein [Acidobacteria bacterium]|nr:radical SAM protein [Acidobacteriota bacterium]